MTDTTYHDSDTPAALVGSGTLATNSQPLNIGDSSYFDGSLDNVMVFNRELTAGEVASLYAAQVEDTIEYAAPGNLIDDKDGYKYTYDYENRIVKIEKPDGAGGWGDVAMFEYDALGMRIARYDAVAGETVYYYYNDNWQVLAEFDGAGAQQRYFIYGNYIDEPLVMSDAGGDYYYAHDHLYSPVALTNTLGQVVERYEYNAYGKASIMDASYNTRTSSSYANPYCFTGRRLDMLDSSELEVMYYRHRCYDAYTGRFYQHDPLGVVLGVSQGKNVFVANAQYYMGNNLYEYVSSKSLVTTDSLGLCPDNPCGSAEEIAAANTKCRDNAANELNDCNWRATTVCGSAALADPPVGLLCFLVYLKGCKDSYKKGIEWCDDVTEWCNSDGEGYPPKPPFGVKPKLWPEPLPKPPKKKPVRPPDDGWNPPRDGGSFR